MNLQAKIAEYVSSHGIRKTFIAEQSGITYYNVVTILNCKRKMTADEFVILCRVLHKDPNYFIGKME